MTISPPSGDNSTPWRIAFSTSGWIESAGTITAGNGSGKRQCLNTRKAVRDQSHRLTDACIAIGRDPSTIDRIWLTGAGDHRPLASVAAFDDAVRHAVEAGITDVVVHHPRVGDPNWDDPPEILDQIAAGMRSA